MYEKVYPVVSEWTEDAYIDAGRYKQLYAQSIADKDAFWAGRAPASIGSNPSPR